MEPEVQTQSEQLELEKVRLKRAELEARARREDKERAQTIEETKQIKFREELRREMAATNITFYPSDDELLPIIEAKTGAKFLVQNSGQFVAEIKGQPIAFTELIQRLAIENPYLLQDRSQIAHLAKPTVRLSRADFPSVAEKATFIEKNGLKAWEALPATSVPDTTKENLTREAYLKMSLSQKVGLNLTEVELGRLLKHGKL